MATLKIKFGADTKFSDERKVCVMLRGWGANYHYFTEKKPDPKKPPHVDEGKLIVTLPAKEASILREHLNTIKVPFEG